MRLLAGFILFSQAVYAVKFPFEARIVPYSEHPSRDLHRRGPGSVPLLNIQNAVYISNITLGGRDIPVLLDTGSSDLWVTGNVPGAKDTGKNVELEYAVGKASGDIFTAPLSFDGYNVTDQAFLLVQDTSTFSTNITSQGYSGLVGLGPNSGSLIRDKLDDNAGSDAMLDRIFQQHKQQQNYITLLLDRRGDPSDPFTGEFTIAELVSGFENITSAPKLSIVKVPGLTDRDQHHQVYTDTNGIIGPDGQPIKADSIVPKAPDGQLIAVFDSGFTLPQVPRSVSDAIYGRVQGAKWSDTNQLWTIPCTQLINITFKFGGQSFPIHPLDASSSDFSLTDPTTGQPVCAGTFQPITSAFSLLGEYDIILGMGFLRNTYTLIDFGDFVDGDNRGDPFVQLLSVTDASSARQDFIKVRLNGVDTTNDPSQALLPASQGQHSPESSAEKKAHLAEKVLSRWPYILMGSLLLFILLVGLCVWKCCCRRRIAARKNAKNSGKRLSIGGVQMGPVKGTPGVYHPLDEPAPPYTGGGYGHQDPYRHPV